MALFNRKAPPKREAKPQPEHVRYASTVTLELEGADILVKREAKETKTYKADLQPSDSFSGLHWFFGGQADLKVVWQQINEEFVKTQAHSLKSPCECCMLLLDERLRVLETLYAQSGSLSSSVPYNLVQVTLFTLDDIVVDLLYNRVPSFDHRIPTLTAILNLIQWYVIQDTSTLLLSQDFAQLINQFFSFLNSLELAQGPTTLPELMFHFLQTNYAVGELYVRHLRERPDVSYFFVHNCLVVYKLIISCSPGDFFHELMPLQIKTSASNSLPQCSALRCYRDPDVTDFLSLILEQVIRLLQHLPVKLDAFSLSDFEAVFQLVIKGMEGAATDHSLRSAVSLMQLIKAVSSKTLINVRQLIPHLKELLYFTLLTYIKKGSRMFSAGFHSDEQPLGRFFVILEQLIAKHFLSEDMEVNLLLMLEVLNMPEIMREGRDIVPVVQCYSLELLADYLDKISSNKKSLISLVNNGLCDILVSPYVFCLGSSVSAAEVRKFIEEGINRTHRIVQKIMSSGLDSTSRLINCLHSNLEANCFSLAYLERTKKLFEYLINEKSARDFACVYFYDNYTHVLTILDNNLAKISPDLLAVYFDVVKILLESRSFSDRVINSADVLSELLRNEGTFDLTIAKLAAGFEQVNSESSLFYDFLNLLSSAQSTEKILKMIRFAKDVVKGMHKSSKHLKHLQDQLIKKIPAIILYKLNAQRELRICSALLELALEINSGFRSELPTLIESLFSSIEEIVETDQFSEHEYREIISRVIQSLATSSHTSRFLTQLFSLMRPNKSAEGTSMILTELKRFTSGSLFSMYTLASNNSLELLIPCYSYPENRRQALEITAEIARCFLNPKDLTTLLKQCNLMLNERNSQGVYDMVGCLRQMTDLNHPLKNDKIPAYENKRKLPRFTYHFRSQNSSMKVSNFGQTFNQDALCIMFWIRPSKAGHIFTLYSESPHNRLGCYLSDDLDLMVYIKRYDSQQVFLATGLKIYLDNWTFISLSFVKKTVSVIVDGMVLRDLQLHTNMANYFKKSKAAHLSFGRKKSNRQVNVPSESFIGDITHFYFIPGTKELPECAFYAGFSTFLEGRPRDFFNSIDYEELTPQQISYVEAVSNKLSLKLHCSKHGELPKIVSLKMQQLKRQDIEAFIDIGRSSSEIKTVSRFVTVCSGYSVLESFHIIGGLKHLVVLLSKVRSLGSSETSQGIVNEVLRTLTNLMTEWSVQTFHEVLHEHLLDVLGAELQRLKETNLVNRESFLCVADLCRQTWLFKLPNRFECDLGTSLVENHPLYRLITDFRIWRDIDRRTFYKVVSSLGALKSTEDSKLSSLKVQVLHYYINLSRTDLSLVQEFSDIDSEFLAKLKTQLRLSDLIDFIDYLIITHKHAATDALQLLLEIIENYSSQDLAQQFDNSEVCFKNLMNTLAITVDNVSTSDLGATRKADIYRTLSSTLYKCFDMQKKTFSVFLRKVEDSSIIDEMGVAVFKLAYQMEKQDMLLFLSKYHECCFRLLRSRPNFFEVLYCLSKLSFKNKEFSQEHALIAELIAEQFAEAPVPNDFDTKYFAFFSFCQTFLWSLDTQVSFLAYIMAVLEEVLALNITEVMLCFLLYLAEDLQSNFKIVYRPDFLARLINAAAKLGCLHCNDPKLPEFVRWEMLKSKLEGSDTMMAFCRREGGFIRILLNLLLKSLAFSAESQVDLIVEMISVFLVLSPPHTVAKFNFRKIASLADLRGSLVCKDKRLEDEPDFFEEEVNILAYLIGELGELLRGKPHLRLPSVYRLFLDAVFRRYRNEQSFMDLYMAKIDTQSYWDFTSSYYNITSVTLPDQSYQPFMTEISRMSSSGLDLKHSEGLLANREVEALEQIKATQSYAALQERIDNPSSQLQKLLTFALVYASLKVRLVEDLIRSKDYNFKVEDYIRTSFLRSSHYRKGSGMVAGNWASRVSRNYRMLGKAHHARMTKQFTRAFEVWHTPSQVKFWKLSNIYDALGRLMRVVPYTQGSQYLDRSSKNYSSRDKSPAKNESFVVTRSMRHSILGSMASTQARQSRQPSTCLLKSQKELVLECERITLGCAIFGNLEVYPDMIIWRSKGAARPRLERFQYGALNSTMKTVAQFKVWKKSELEEVCRKPFMHQPTAVELYLTSGRSYLCNLYDAGSREEFFRQLEEFKYKAGLQSRGLDPVEAARRWKSGQMSNFEYLILLNKAAGRSLHNLSQYYVFPWVITDYDSSTLDNIEAQDSREVRDLAKPIGCLSPEKKQEAVERYEMFSSEEGLKPYHYGSHYSSGGIVLYYLLRLEPYTYQGILFQDGHFDVPDRVFSSLRLSWCSSYSNSGDLKELIPQFFYLPAFLLNLNCYDLGQRLSDSRLVNDVEMPPWALENEQQDDFSVYRFVYMHSQVLESQPVSSKLADWIDLIFGASQDDPEKTNVFFPLTYADNFEDQIQDCREFDVPIEAIMTQVAYFGQTPMKLFRTPHESRNQLQRKKLLTPQYLKLIDSKIDVSRPSASPQSQGLTVHKLILGESQSCIVYERSGHFSIYFFDAAKTEPARLYDNIISARFSVELDFIAEVDKVFQSSEFVMLSEKTLIVGRFTDLSFKFFRVIMNPVKLELRLTVFHHLAVVNCLAGVKDMVLVTGSIDGSMALWDVTDVCSFKKQLRGHDKGIRQMKVNNACQLVVSLSGDSTILLHDLRSGDLFNSIETSGPVSSIDLSKLGLVAAVSGSTLTLTSINGPLGRGTLREVQLPCADSEDIIMSTKFTSEGDFLLLSGNFNAFIILAIYSLKVQCKLIDTFSPVQALELDSEEKFLWVLPAAHASTKLFKTAEMSDILRKMIAHY